MSTNSAVEPQRTCVGCRTARSQTQLVRCALADDGHPVISRTAPGRGAWLCARNITCLSMAIKRRGFERAWKRPISASTAHELEIAYDAMLTNMEN